MWFRDTFGFDEVDRATVLSQIAEDGEHIVSLPTGRRMRRGTLDVLSLERLCRSATALPVAGTPTTLTEIFGDVREIHADPASSGATFQVASQANLLEMAQPTATPELGIDVYWHDHTQGPACAIACGAGTLHRNYLVRLDGVTGQTAHHQINTFAALGAALGMTFAVRNGYIWPTRDQLEETARIITSASPEERDALAATLSIGVQSDTEVTWRHAGHTVTQAYCSALPIAYVSGLAGAPWEPLAQLVLDAAYEATLCVAASTAARTGNRVAYLTRLGAGAFGNDLRWVDAAIAHAADRARTYGLDLRLVTYRSS